MSDVAVDKLAPFRSEKTVRAYSSDLKKFTKWYFETNGNELTWDTVGPLDIAEFKRYLLNLKQKPATINRALTALSVYFKSIGKMGDENPCQGISMVAQIRLAPKSLTRQDQQKFLATVRKYGNERDYNIIVLLLHTGLRVDELCSLQIGDILLSERKGLLKVMGKGTKYREVPLNSTARSVLSTYLASCKPETWLYYSKRNSKNKLEPRNVQAFCTKYSRISGIHVTPHLLRHTFCKNLIDAGESIDRVALLAGHSSLNTTARYTRPTGADLENSVEKLSWT